MFDIETLKPIISMIVRYFLAILGSFLVKQGYMSEELSAGFIAGCAFLIVALISSLVRIVKTEKKIETALQLPAGSSKEKLKELV